MIDRAVVRFRRAVTHFFPGQCECGNRVLGVGVWWGYGWMGIDEVCRLARMLCYVMYVVSGLFVWRVKRVKKVGLCC